MSARIIPFVGGKPSPASPIASFTRIGEAHQQVASLFAAGRLSVDRAVIDASRDRYQRDFIAALRDNGSQIFLDTEVAELAAPAKFGGHVRHAPWASADAVPLGINHFRDPAFDIIGQIARFAARKTFDTVISPAHYLGDPSCEGWLAVDLKSCERLRRDLDAEGGKYINIDYPVILPISHLNDKTKRKKIVSALFNMPIENIWVRVSGLTSRSGSLALRRYLESMAELHVIGKPIIADHIGGFIGVAAVAFGAVSALAHGVGERERFDAAQWHKEPVPRKEGARFGRAIRVSMPGLQGSVTRDELAVLISAKNGRRICACNDRSCCAHGFDDMLKDPKGHGARQESKLLVDA